MYYFIFCRHPNQVYRLNTFHINIYTIIRYFSIHLSFKHVTQFNFIPSYVHSLPAYPLTIIPGDLSSRACLHVSVLLFFKLISSIVPLRIKSVYCQNNMLFIYNRKIIFIRQSITLVFLLITFFIFIFVGQFILAKVQT